jgi:hypothetical protein
VRALESFLSALGSTEAQYNFETKPEMFEQTGNVVGEHSTFMQRILRGSFFVLSSFPQVLVQEVTNHY